MLHSNSQNSSPSVSKDWRLQPLVLYHDNREYYWVVMTFYVMFSAAFFLPCIALMAYWTCQFTFSWVCESPPCCERSYHYEQLTASRAVHSLNTAAEFVRIYFPVNRNIPSRGGIPAAGWGSGRRKQMLVLERRQHVQGDQEPGWCAWTEKERNVCFLDVSFKWGESYKKHTSRTEVPSQGQSPVRQAHMQHCIFLETYPCYSYNSFSP